VFFDVREALRSLDLLPVVVVDALLAGDMGSWRLVFLEEDEEEDGFWEWPMNCVLGTEACRVLFSAPTDEAESLGNAEGDKPPMWL
jgi:hypothetical protein